MKLGPSPLWICLLAPCLAQPPDLEAQRAAMKKLDFLAGTWLGEVRVRRETANPSSVPSARSHMRAYNDGRYLET